MPDLWVGPGAWRAWGWRLHPVVTLEAEIYGTYVPLRATYVQCNASPLDFGTKPDPV